VALPTDECDALHAAGRIVLGDPVTDPAKTTYPVRPVARGTSSTSVPRQAVPARQAPAAWQTPTNRQPRPAAGQALPTRQSLPTRRALTA
jgi:hypothetical protein